MKHGPRFDVLGFRIGNFAYCTDVNEIPPETIAALHGVETLVLGALRYRPHPTHFHLEAAVAVTREIDARITYLTHLSHDFDHTKVEADLPEGISLAFDGLRLTLETETV